MRDISLNDDFAEKCKNKFYFLIEEYDFKYIDSKKSDLELNVIYRNDILAVSILYELLDNRIIVNLFRVPINEKLDRIAEEDELFLGLLIKLINPQFITSELDPPKFREYENALSNIAFSLKKYGYSVLEGKFWISSSTIMQIGEVRKQLGLII